MGIDYVQLDQDAEVIPPPVFPWSVGRDDNGWPVGDGGGPNATFVQEAEGARHFLGSHWEPFTGDSTDIITRAVEMLPESVPQTGYGDVRKTSRRQPFRRHPQLARCSYGYQQRANGVEKDSVWEGVRIFNTNHNFFCIFCNNVCSALIFLRKSINKPTALAENGLNTQE